jgi:hypothetical protein
MTPSHMRFPYGCCRVPDERMMNVTLNGYPVLSNFNIYKTLSYKTAGSYAFRLECPDGILSVQLIRFASFSQNVNEMCSRAQTETYKLHMVTDSKS